MGRHLQAQSPESFRIPQAPWCQAHESQDLLLHQLRGDAQAGGELCTAYRPHRTPARGRLFADIQCERSADDDLRPEYHAARSRPGNRVPTDRINPVARAAQQYYPLPNSPGRPFTNQQNLVLQSSYPEPQDRIDTKVDHNFNPRQRIMGRYSFMDSIYSKPNFWGNVADPGCCEPMFQRLQNAMVDFTQIVGTSHVLNVRHGMGRVSGNRVPWSTTMSGENAFDITSLGLPASVARDDIKLTARLTINLGFRWDLESGTTERYDRLTAIDPYVRNPLSDVVGMELRGGTLFAGDSLGRRAIRNTSMTQFNPRFGIAYQLTPATTIRSGYGIFCGMPPFAAGRHYTGAAFQSETPWMTTVDGITPIGTLNNPFPNGYNFFTGTANGLTTQAGFTIWDGWPDALRTPYNQQWNFSIQRQFGAQTMMEVAYAGNKGTNLAYFLPSVELNQLHPSLLSMGNQLLEQVPIPSTV